jgi:hypothetical protein
MALSSSIFQTYLAASSATTTATSPATATAAARRTTTGAFTGRSLAVLVLLGAGLGLAGKLDRDLTTQDLLTAQLTNGLLGLRRGRDVDKSIANGLVRARVLRDGNGLARMMRQLATYQPGYESSRVEAWFCRRSIGQNRATKQQPLDTTHGDLTM